MKIAAHKFSFLAVFISLYVMTLSNCTKPLEPTLTYPTTYRFNTPIIAQKFDYRYSDTTNVWKDLTALDTFEDNTDTIINQVNEVLKNEFQFEYIQSIILEDATNATVAYGMLDTLGKFIPTDTVKETYQLVGNDVNFSSGKTYLFDYSFREMYACRKMVFVLDIAQGKTSTFLFDDTTCKISNIPILETVKKANVNNTYKTAHIRTVHTIYSNYK